MKQFSIEKCLALACFMFLAIAMHHKQVIASQGCPFNDGSCEEYCKQQGCNFGYCGHFAWIQCICRKCGQVSFKGLD